MRPKNHAVRLLLSVTVAAVLLTGVFLPTINRAQGQVLTSITVTPADPTIEVGQTQQFTATKNFSDGSSQVLSANASSWTPAASISTPRYYHTATLLQDGSVLVAGGYNSSVSFLSAERYYPSTNTWVSAGSMTTARVAHTATLLPNGKVLVVGGIRFPQDTVTNTTELYDPATNTWSAGPNLTMGIRAFHSAVLLNTGRVLVVAGVQGWPDCTYRETAELYNPAANTWTATGSLHLARTNATTTILADGRVLLAGGPANNCPTPNVGLNQAEVYDPVAGVWSVTGNLSGSRYSNFIALLPNGNALLAGGHTVGGTTATSDVYDPAAGTFSLTGSMAAGRATSGGLGDNGATAVLQNGQVLVAGGHTFTGAILGSSELYNPATGSWAATASLGIARTHNTATLLQDGRVLAVGGHATGGVALSSTEIYGPQVPWMSSDPAVATVDQNGLATAVGLGTTTITAASGGLSGNTTLTVAEDELPPATTAMFAAPNANGWHRTDVTVLMETADSGGPLSASGVQSITYALSGAQNGGGTINGSSTSVVISSEGTTTLAYHAVDNNGNVEPEQTLTVRIDKTAPWLSYPSQVQANASSSAGAVINFIVSASDPLSGLAGPVQVSPFSSGATFPLGTTQETVTAADAAGNVATAAFDVIVSPGRPSIQVFGGNFPANGTPHPATATATTFSGTPIGGSFTFTYVPNAASAPVSAGRYSAAASFTSADPAFTNAFPWTTMAPDPDPKVSPAVAEINGRLYVQGFHQDASGNQGSFQPRLSIYDPTSNAWSVGTPPGIIRAYANAVAINGKMYVVGGCVMSDCNSPTNALEIYDPATGSWSNGAPMPTVRFTATAGVINNKLYVTGGTRGGYNPTNVTEVYDPVTNTWTTGTPIPVSRELAMGAVVNGELYVMGGWQRGTVNAPINRVDVFNPATGWSVRAAMPSSRYGAAAGVIGGHIHVAGGAAAGGTMLGTNETYDPSTNLWLAQVAMPTARTYTSAGVVGSKLYVIDGMNGAQLSTNEMFDPFLTAVITIQDSAPPTTTATPSPAPNAAGWNNGNSVSVTLNATDSDGVQSIVYSTNGTQNMGPFTVPGNSTSLTIGTEGTTTVNYHAIDNAGNAEGDHALSIRLDRTPPNVSYPFQLQASATSGQGAVVNFSVSAFDSLSGVVSGPTITTTFNGSPVIPALLSGSTFPIGTTTETVTATDAAGNTFTASFDVIVSPGDTTPPTTNANYPAPNANGWNRFNVFVSLNAFDSSSSGSPSGVKSITYSMSGAQNGGGTFNTSSTSFTISNEGTTTVTYHATDNRDNVEADRTFTVRLDKTSPAAASLSNVNAQATSTAGAVVTFDLAPSDPLSGVDSVVFSQGLPSGAIFPHGTTSESATITDRAGNTTFRSFNVTVNKTLLSIAVSPPNATIDVGDQQFFQAMGHFTSGPDQMLPTGGSGGSGGSGGGSGGSFVGGSYWQIQSSLAEALNMSACGSSAMFTSQAFSAGSGSSSAMFGDVHTTFGNPQILQVDGTVNAQEVHLTLSCIPNNGATGSIDASWTGTRFEGTWSFSGATGHATILGWSSKAPLSAPRFSLGAAAVNGIVYAIGGGNPSLPSPVDAYNPANNSWSTVSQLPISSEGPAVAALNGIIYVVGGHVAGGASSGVLQGYDPVNNVWLAGLAAMPTARAHLALVAAGGNLYAIGGETGSGSGPPTNVVERYNPATNAWTTLASMSSARSFLVAGALNNDSVIIAAGGNGSGGSTELYNVAGNSWTSGPAMISSGGSPAAVVVNNALFVFGIGGRGVNMFRPTGPQPTGWAGLAPMPTSRGQLGVAVVGDVVYAIGGQLAGGSTATAAVEAFSTPLPSNFSVTSGSGSGGGGGGGGSSTPTVQWSSSDSSIAGINSSGQATGNAPGSATIIATAAGVSCATTNACGTLTVVAPTPPTHITFTLAPGSAPLGVVTITIIDRVTGQLYDTFDVPIGEPQEVSVEDADQIRLVFSAPNGYAVSPTQVEPNLHGGDLVIPLLFTVVDTTAPVMTLLTPAPNDLVPTAPSTVTVDVEVVDAGGASAVTINGVNATNAGPTALGTRWRANVPGPTANAALPIAATATDFGNNQGSLSALIDNDGIATPIDRGRTTGADQSSVHSSEFNDSTTRGTIYRDPGATASVFQRGAAVGVTLASGTRVRAAACTGTEKSVVLNSVGESADLSCSGDTITVTAISTPNVIEVYKQNTAARYMSQMSCFFLPLAFRHSEYCQLWYTSFSYTYDYLISLGPGQSVSTGSPVTAGANNSGPVHVTLVQIADDPGVPDLPVAEFNLDPGESADVDITPGENRQDHLTFKVLAGSVTFEVGAATQTLGAGEESAISLDLAPPIVTLPLNIAAEATSSSGAPVTFSAAALDAVSGVRPVTCEPASGSTFPLGSTAVQCSAVDAQGNGNTGSFSVTVADTTKPVLTAPGNITVEATSAGGAVVAYTASATDLLQTVAVTCDSLPVPATRTFPIGTSTVSCAASDGGGNTQTGSFNVTVTDGVPVLGTLPTIAPVVASSRSGAVVTFATPTASDAVDGPLPVTCTPPSGSTFGIGSTVVTCSATDSQGHTASGTFTVVVQPRPRQLVVAPTELSFTTDRLTTCNGSTLGTAPAQQSLVLTNTTTSTMWYLAAVTSGGSWLTGTPIVSYVPAGQSRAVNFTVNAQGLAAGSYSGTVTIFSLSSASANPYHPDVDKQVVPVTLTLNPAQPRLCVTPTSLNFGTLGKTTQSVAELITVTNAGDGTLAGLTWTTPTASSGRIEVAATADDVRVRVVAGSSKGSQTGSFVLKSGSQAQTISLRWKVN